MPKKNEADLKEVIQHIDTAAELFGHVAGSFADLSTLLEAITASAVPGSLSSRLAKLGVNLCESLESDFCDCQDDFKSHAKRYSASLGIDPLRRFRSVEDSSRGGE
jgi:hypothetical protein